jgi:hypothetical protein
MEVNGQIYYAATTFPSDKKLQVPVGNEAGFSSEPV